MPFDKDTAAAAGSKGGLNRWKSKPPETTRNKMFSLKLSPSEYDDISAKASALGLSRAELIVRAVKDYNTHPH